MYIDNIEEIENVAAQLQDELYCSHGVLGNAADENIHKKGEYIFYNEVLYRVAKEF